MANGEYKQRVSDIISVEDMESWTTNNLIIISAGTGRGKSYFIKNMLYKYAKAQSRKILFLIHRRNCVTQFQSEIERDNKTDVIDIMTYQKIEYDVLYYHYHVDYDKYAYVVCDEFHYFISDAMYNNKTDISFDEIVNADSSVKIFMSATGDEVEKYCKQHLPNKLSKQIIKYGLPPDYSYVRSLIFFNNDNDIEHLAQVAIDKGYKAIIFIQSVKKAYKLYKKFFDKSLFNCSANNEKGYYEYVDEEKISNMLKNERFEENLLITTSCLDAGVNILDKNVRAIIVDITDIGSMVQCLGRKRCIDDDDRVTFFIKAIGNQRLSGLRETTRKSIKQANYLLSSSPQEYIEAYPRQVDKSGIIYDTANINKQKNMLTKRVNRLMLSKRRYDIELFTYLMQEKYGYCEYISQFLGKKYHILSKDHSVEAFLNEYVQKNIIMLQKKDRKSLIDKLNVKSNGKQLKGINALNEALKELELPYKIVQYKTHRVVDDERKQFKQAWRVERTKSPD